MRYDKNDCVDFWLNARERIKVFDKLDDSGLVFGASSHNYHILPTVTDKEILKFEAKNGFELPTEYLTFLQTFGAGGAGPHHGIYDFRKRVLPYAFLKPFPYSSTFEFSEDDDPIWNYDGLAFICEQGCGTDYYIELNGNNVGQIWCSWQDECSIEGSFLEFYKSWLENVDIHLHRFHLLKELGGNRVWLEGQPKMSIDDVISHMKCGYKQRAFGDDKYVPEGQVWIEFEKTAGRVYMNQEREVFRIDLRDRYSIC